VENRQEVQGSKDFPLVYDSKIFLCATQDQRERFLNDPATYAVEDIRRPGVCPHCKAPMNRQTAEKSRFQIRFGGSRYQFPDRSHMEAFLLSPLKYLR
jgi:YHS domain-containing protein